MPPRWNVLSSMLVALALLQTACSDLLGLDGLSYSSDPAPGNEGSGGQAAFSGAGGGAYADAQTAGGSTGSEDYPATGWAMDSILVSAQPVGERATYYRYEPSTRALFRYQYAFATSDPVRKFEWGSAQTAKMTHVVCIPADGGGDLLIGYDRVDGWRQKTWVSDTAEQNSVETEIVNAGYSHYIAVSWLGEWFTLAYDDTTGDYRWVPAQKTVSEVTTPVTSGHGNLGAGWEVIRGFDWGRGAGLLLMKPGLLELHGFPDETSLGAGGAGPSEGIVSGPEGTASGLRKLATFALSGFVTIPTTLEVVTKGQEQLLFFYDDSSGLVEAWQLEQNQGVWALTRNDYFSILSDGTAGAIRKGIVSWTFASSEWDVTAMTFDGKVGAETIFGPRGDSTSVR